MNFREILGEITDFCSENYIWVILMAVVLATVFIAAVLHGRKKNTGAAMRESHPGQKKDDWMDDFEQRMAAFERREGRTWEKVTQLDGADVSEGQETSGNQAADPAASTPQWENPQTCITEEMEGDNMPTASASAGCIQVNENGGMDVKVKVKVTGIRVVYDPGKAQDTEPAEVFASEEKTVDNTATDIIQKETPVAATDNVQRENLKKGIRMPEETNSTAGSQPPAPDAADNVAGMTQEKCENETPDPEIVIHKINIVKKEAIDENVSVSRSGRIYSEEQLRQQIRK